MSTLRVSTITDASGGNTAVINGIPLRQGVVNTDNKVINGSFDFWQRGTNFDTGLYTGFTADRWTLNRSGGNASVARVSISTGTQLGQNSPRFAMTYGVANQSAVSDVTYLEHRIEDVNSYAGQTITILGWARRTFGSGNMSIGLVQYFGTGGSPSTAVAIGNAQIVTLTTSWQPFAVSVDVPNLTGKTLGTNNDHSLFLRIFGSAGSNFNSQSGSIGIQTISMDLWGIHARLGSHTIDAANLYRAPDQGQEFAKCLRYYWTSAGIYFPSSTAQSHRFPVPMRTTPALSWSGSGGSISSQTQFGFVGFSSSNSIATIIADAEL